MVVPKVVLVHELVDLVPDVLFRHEPFHWSPLPSFLMVQTLIFPTIKFMLRQQIGKYGSLFLSRCVATRSPCTDAAIALIVRFVCRSCVVFSQVA